MRVRLSITSITAIVLGGAALAQSAPPGPQAPQPQAATALLAGRVIETPSGRPIPDAIVSLSGTRQPTRPVMADARGRFVFTGLAPATITVFAQRPGYGPASTLARSVALTAGGRLTDLTIRLEPLASVGGVVRDDAGDPIVGVEVIVLRRAIVNGRLQLRRAGQVATDDRGTYRIYNVPPGDVLVCACTRNPIPFDPVLLKTLASQPMQLLSAGARAVTQGADAVALDDTLVTFAPTLHPSSPTTTGAARVRLGPGDDRGGVDITVVPQRAFRVSGAIAGAPGPMHASFVRLIPAGESEEGASVSPLVPALVQPDGRFDFTHVPPGQYTLRVTYSETKGAGGPSGAALAFIGNRGNALASPGASVPGAAQFWAAEPIVVTDRDVLGVPIVLREGPRISGRVEFAGTAPRPAPKEIASRAVVRLDFLSAQAVFSGWVPLGRVGEDGTFSLSALPGRHALLANAMPPWLNLKSITVGGEDVIDRPVELGTADLTDVVVTFSDSPMASLSGTVTGATSTSEDAAVLVFPTDRRYWEDPGAAYRRFRATAVRRDGSFLTASLPAGEYFVVAVSDDQVDDWQESGRLEVLARTAERLQLADGDKRAIEIRR